MMDKVNRNDQWNRLQQRKLNQMNSYSGYSVPFGAILEEKLQKNEEVQFSKHAKQRMEQRGIEVTNNLRNDLNSAVAKAKAKGAKDVVIIGEKSAFIVNIPNNVVVTSMTQREMKENIFTNIDSAVIL